MQNTTKSSAKSDNSQNFNVLIIALNSENQNPQTESINPSKLPQNATLSQKFGWDGIENAAQTRSSIVAKSYFIDDEHNEKEGVKVVGFISGIKKLQVHSLPKQGDTIQTKAALISRFDADEYKICSMKCTTYFESELLFEAELNLFIQKTN